MPGEINIGGPTSKSTWARLRSPIWAGTGYRDAYPNSKNWGKTTIPNATGGGPAGNFYRNRKYFSYGYEEPLTPLLRAFPVSPGSDQGVVVYQITSMALGVHLQSIQGPYTGYDPDLGGPDPTTPYDPTPVIIDLYLSLGEALFRPETYYPGLNTFQADEVIQGYGAYGLGPGEGIGYDINSARETLIGGVVNVTVKPGPVASGVGTETKDITITEDLFPDNMSWGAGWSTTPRLGILIGRYTWAPYPESNWPYGYEDNSWPLPSWTINSLTLPE